MNNKFEIFIHNATNVKPSERQLQWFDTEMYAFVHFTVNTYTGKEWGDGKEDPNIFNPTELDCDEWVSAVKSAGCKGLILTAKHHDGFCLWPTKTTEHCIRNSKYLDGKGDIVREAAEACRRGEIKFGIYLSPWDRNCKWYGTDKYNDFYVEQLTELLTGYGELFAVWQDGACGEGPDGKKQIYDFERYNSIIRKYQPNACIVSDEGPDVRWCGNEAGSSRKAEWAVVPSELCGRAEIQTEGSLLEGSLEGIYNWDNDLGSLFNIAYSKGLVFAGSEMDMSIRDGWFYHPEEKPHSLERLFNTYLHSVGHNSCFHLNVPPMPNGKIDPKDKERLKELGDKIQKEFGTPLPAKWEKVSSYSSGQCVYEVVFDQDVDINYVILSEDISKGQRVESFQLKMPDNPPYRSEPFFGDTIGHKQICPISSVGKGINNFKLRITATRGEVFIKDILVYGDYTNK